MEQRSKRMLMAMAALFLLLAIVQRFAGGSEALMPWWVTALVLATLFCGYMWIRTTIEEKNTEAEWIEQEGRVYIRRIEKERQERFQQQEES